MAAQNSPIRNYLTELPPATRAKLLVALERARRDGALGKVEAYLLGELRQINDADASTDAQAAFFAPLAPFLVDEELPTKLPGRIARHHLDRIWSWIAREVIPVEVVAHDSALAAAAGAKARGAAASRLLADGHARLQEALAEAHRSPDVARKVAAYVGGPRVYAELEDVAGVLTERAWIAKAIEELPQAIDPDNPEHVELIVGHVQRSGGRHAAYLAVLTHARMEQTARLATIAAQAVGSEDVKVVAASAFAPLVAIVLSDVERTVGRMMSALDRPDGGHNVAGDLRDYNAIARQLRAAIDLDDCPSDWAKRLTDARTRLSTRLARELAELPPLLRRSVRSMRAFGQRPPVASDPIDVARVCTLIELFDVARLASGELALNELVARMRGDIEAYVEGLANALADELRTVAPGKREVALEHAAATVRLHEALYGAARAAVVRRSFEVAGSTSLAPLLRAAGE
jgi:hypothetical protein